MNEPEPPDRVHLYPLFEREHDMSLDCWCKPEPVAETNGELVIHRNQEQGQ